MLEKRWYDIDTRNHVRDGNLDLTSRIVLWIGVHDKMWPEHFSALSKVTDLLKFFDAPTLGAKAVAELNGSIGR
jgi:hypothetical protein